MKVSVSLTARASESLTALTALSGAKRSSVVEAAFNHFTTLSEAEQLRLIRESGSTKKAYTRSRWRTTFWAAMRDEFGITLKLRSPEREFAPHTYQGFDIVFLLNSVNDPEPEHGDFIVHVMKNTHLGGGADSRQTFRYPRSYSPFEAAQKTAHWVQNHMKMRYYVLIGDDGICCRDGHIGPEQCTPHLSSNHPMLVAEADGNGKFTNAQSLLIQAAKPGESAGHIMDRVASPIAGRHLDSFRPFV